MAAFTMVFTPITSYKIENDTYDCYHPVVSVQDGINGAIPVVGVPYITRSFDYYCADTAARIAFQSGLATSGCQVVVDSVTYTLLSANCTDAIFTGDQAAVQVWKYHIELMRSLP